MTKKKKQNINAIFAYIDKMGFESKICVEFTVVSAIYNIGRKNMKF